jgi:SagB-type dehydrogenase family enzyme
MRQDEAVTTMRRGGGGGAAVQPRRVRQAVPVPATGEAQVPASIPDLPSLAAAFERLLAARRSVRSIGPDPVPDELLLRVLWAAQGITGPEGRRTTPSAGGRHPLEVLLVTPAGVHRYNPETREIELIRPADRRGQLAGAALSQDVIARAPATIVISAVYARTESRFGSSRGPRYVMMEAGHACQNILLEAVALGLAAVPIGSFDDRRCQLALGLSHDERPLYLIPIGAAIEPPAA